jgi:hypothetical protein
MDGDRVVIGRKGSTSMVKVRWEAATPQGLCDLETAEELGAKWEGDELVVYDLPGLLQLLEYYEGNNEGYMIDND